MNGARVCITGPAKVTASDIDVHAIYIKQGNRGSNATPFSISGETIYRIPEEDWVTDEYGKEVVINILDVYMIDESITRAEADEIAEKYNALIVEEWEFMDAYALKFNTSNLNELAIVQEKIEAEPIVDFAMKRFTAEITEY